MKVTLSSILAVIFITFVFALNSFAQDYTRFNLPEGAIARYGKGAIRAMAYSPDGNHFAVASSTDIWLYDANTGAELSLLARRPTHSISSVVYSPDGRTIAGLGNQVITLWDTATGHRKVTLDDTSIYFTGFAYSPDSRTFAVSMDTPNRGGIVMVNLYDVDTGVTKGTLIEEPGSASRGIRIGFLQTPGNTLAYSPDGRTLAVVIHPWGREKKGMVNLYDVGTGEIRGTLTGFEYPVTGLAYSPDGRTVATVNRWDRTLQLWDVGTGRVKTTLEWDAEYLSSFAYSPDGRTLAVLDDGVKVWDAITGELKATLKGDGYLRAFTYSPDGHTIATVGDAVSRSVQLWDTTTWRSKSTLLLKGYEYFDRVAYSPDGRFLATGGVDAYLWDAVSGKHLGILTEHRWRVASVAFSPDGRLLATGSSDNTVRLWDAVSGNSLKTLTGHHSEIWTVAFSPDGKTIAGSGCPSNTISLWDVATGQRTKSLTGHGAGFYNVVFSPDGKTIAGSGYGIGEHHICIWDVATGQHRKALMGKMPHYFSLAFSPDGKVLASNGQGGVVQLWDTATWTPLQTLNSQPITCLAFNSDGSILASGGGGTIQLWDIATGQELQTFNGPGGIGISNSITFSPDDSMIASVIQGVLFLWKVTPFNLPTPQDTDTQQTAQQETGIQPYQRELVQLVYFRPSDRVSQQGIDAALDTLIRDTQYFYTQQMQDHGGKTFAFETDAAGNARVHHITGKFDDAYYHQDTYQKVVKEVAEQFDTSKNACLIAIDVSTQVINNAGTCGVGGGGWTSRDNETWLRNFGGTAVIPASGVCFSPRIAAHELGHVFSLEHDFRDDDYLMAYGTQERLSQCATEWLDAHRFFNNDPTSFNDPATLKMHSSRVLGTNIRQFQFQLTDPDGLHQVQLLLPVTASDPAPGTKLHSFRSLNGKNQTVEFTVTGLAAAPGTEVTLQVIDARGNITKEQFPVVLDGGINASPIAVSIIPDEALMVGASTMPSASVIPAQTSLLPNYPNPFNPETWLPYQLAVPADVTLRIYGVNGTLVRTLFLGHQLAGMYHRRSRAAYWDGNNEIGEPVASGVYFYTLTAGDFTATRKMLIQK